MHSTPYSMTTMQRDYASYTRINQSRAKVPDNARVWRPPAATVAILTPGFNVTRHGNAERGSSPDDELSATCFAEDNLLRFVLSSPDPRGSLTENAPPVDCEP